MLALEAMCEEPFNLYGMQATTHPCAPLLIFNGPIAKEARHQRRPQRVRATAFAAQRDDRPRGAARAASTSAARSPASATWRPPARRRSSPSAWRRTKPRARGSRCTSSADFPADASTVTVVARRRPAQRQRPREHHRRRHPHDDRRHDDDHRLEQRRTTTAQPCHRVRPRARADGRRRRLFARPT